MNYNSLKYFRTGIIAVLILTVSHTVFSQTLVTLPFNQPPELVADAGVHTTINAGEDIVIGGLPTALGGVSPYAYNWDYASFLNSQIVPNPVATPPGSLTFSVLVTDDNGCTDTDVVDITVIGGTGFSDEETGIRFNLFPNPTSGSFTIDIDNITVDKELKVTIISLAGQKVYEAVSEVRVRFEEEINISSWPKGYYIIRIDGESTHITKQIILH